MAVRFFSGFTCGSFFTFLAFFTFFFTLDFLVVDTFSVNVGCGCGAAMVAGGPVLVGTSGTWGICFFCFFGIFCVFSEIAPVGFVDSGSGVARSETRRAGGLRGVFFVFNLRGVWLLCTATKVKERGMSQVQDVIGGVALPTSVHGHTHTSAPSFPSMSVFHSPTINLACAAGKLAVGAVSASFETDSSSLSSELNEST